MPVTSIDWDAIVAAHGALVWQTAWRLLRHESDAADCFQTTFLSAVEVARREHVEHWPALLKKLATARAIDVLRRRMRDADGRSRGADLAAIPDPSPAPEERAAERELHQRLQNAIVSLPHMQAQAFCLAVIEALPHAVVAAQLHVSVAHVGVLVHRARGTIRRLLEPGDVATRVASGAPP